MSRRPLIVIAGPTASGKTALSIALAKRLDGEVVSADSMQVYRRLNIGTAKPTSAEMDGVPHHMLDVVEPWEDYSVSRYEAEAAACVDDILARGRQPIICGGTGLYINALLKGSGFLPAGDETLRQSLEAEWLAQGPAVMWDRLRQIDAQAAQRIHLNDKKRILRALEVYKLTGTTITQHNLKTRQAPARYDARLLALCTEPRQILYDRIGSRVDKMLADGLLEEAEALYSGGMLRGTAAQAIGYKELSGYFEGRVPFEQATALIVQKSCNYAKRQLTWFRADDRIHWIVYNHPGENDRLLTDATIFLNEAR